MNVLRNAYFTSDYLDLKLSPNSYRGTPTAKEAPGLPSVCGTEIPISPITRGSDKFGDDSDELFEEITPSQLVYLPEKPKKHRVRSSVDYYNFYRHNNSNSDFDSIATEVPEVQTSPKKVHFSGYYINQQKRIEEAEDSGPTPRSYTHKTFKDVFEKDEDDRFNPIDLVFDDPEKIREQEQKKTITRAFKTVQKKIGVNDYTSYDYYRMRQQELDRRIAMDAEKLKKEEKEARKQEKEEAKKRRGKGKPKFEFLKRKKEGSGEIFVDNLSEDSETENAGEAQENKPLNKQLKQKWRRAKKLIGENYMENYEKELEAREQIKPGMKSVGNGRGLLSEAADLQAVNSSSSHYGFGPNENFHPLWNYLLSWVVYPSAPCETAIAEVKSEPLFLFLGDRSGKKEKRKKTKLKNSVKILPKYKHLIANWNQPMSAYLADQKRPGGGAMMIPYTHLGQIVETDYGSESGVEQYEIEFLDGEELEEELVLNPATGKLEALNQAPPTSSSAMLVGSRGGFLYLHEGAPLQIVSNVNRLIKSIKVMKILFAPIDVIAENFPAMQTIVILLELVIFMWILYELSLLIDAICMAVKAVCAPMIAIGKFMNRVV